MRNLPIRIRLTAAFAALMAVVLVLVGAFVYLRYASELDASLDDGLRARADELASFAGRPGGARLGTGDRLVEAGESFAQIIGPRDELLDASPSAPRPVLTRAQLARARRAPLYADSGPLPGADDRMRVLARAAGSAVVVVGATSDDRDEALASLRNTLLLGGPLALLLASLAGYTLASAALRPVESMRRRAAEISRLDTGERLPVPDSKDELAQLGATLNEMLARLERSVQRERGFVANASHELRTPLALLKTELELALRERRSVDELRAAVASAAEETDRLVNLAEDLLVLARADQGRLVLRNELLDARFLLERVARRFSLRASEQGRALRVEIDGRPRLWADAVRLEQALANLVDNALRHGEGEVVLAAREDNGRVELGVSDDGPGFAEEDRARAFERFAPGLGLAIVAAIAQAHGGRAEVANRAHGGAEVLIGLPASSSSHPGGVEQQP